MASGFERAILMYASPAQTSWFQLGLIGYVRRTPSKMLYSIIQTWLLNPVTQMHLLPIPATERWYYSSLSFLRYWRMVSLRGVSQKNLTRYASPIGLLLLRLYAIWKRDARVLIASIAIYISTYAVFITLVTLTVLQSFSAHCTFSKFIVLLSQSNRKTNEVILSSFQVHPRVHRLSGLYRASHSFPSLVESLLKSSCIIRLNS